MEAIPNISWLTWKMWIHPANWWKMLLGPLVFSEAVPVWFHWRVSLADDVGNSGKRRQGFLRNVFHGTVSRERIYFGYASTGELRCCGVIVFFPPYNVNGAKLIINQKLICYQTLNGNASVFFFKVPGYLALNKCCSHLLKDSVCVNSVIHPNVYFFLFLPFSTRSLLKKHCKKQMN